MPRTLEIRDLDDEVYAGLVRHAADAGITVPELLRRHATGLATERATWPAARPTAAAWRDRTRRRASDASSADVNDALDELRGAWPPS